MDGDDGFDGLIVEFDDFFGGCLMIDCILGGFFFCF